MLRLRPRKPALGASSDSPSVSEERARTRRRLKNGAKQVLSLAVDALPLVVSATESVPYLGAVSTALTKIMTAQREVEMFKVEWRLAMNDVQTLQSIIDQAKEERDPSDVLSESEKKMFSDLESTLEDVLSTLKACNASPLGWPDRVKMWVNREDMSDMVNQSRQKLRSAVEFFKIKLDINQRADIRTLTSSFARMQTKMLPSMGNQESVHEGAAYSHIRQSSLPPKPLIFYGRQVQLDHIVGLMMSKTPARIAILGSGGLGKTTLALAALHHQSSTEMYSHRRFFISCEAFTTAADLAFGIVKALGLPLGYSDNLSPVHVLISFLSSRIAALCLDNFETPWERDEASVELLLTRLAGIPGLSILITLRGASRPVGVSWTKPLLPPIGPPSLDATLNIWDDICGSHDDYALKLIEAVGRVPLAVVHLAHLAESETCEALWARWHTERVRLIRRTSQNQDRLSSLAISIEMSLTSPRLATEPTAVSFLSLLCTLPQGMPEARLPVFERTFNEDLPHMRGCITVLKQCALVTPIDGFLRVLPTVREYINSEYPFHPSLRMRVIDLYCTLILDDVPDDETARRGFLEETITPELENIRSVLTRALSDDLPNSDAERLLHAAMEMSWLYGELSLANHGLLDHALPFASAHHPPLVPQVLRQRAQHHLFTDVEEAASLFERALARDHDLNDTRGQAEDHHGIGIAHIRRGHEETAIEHLELARELHAGGGDNLGQAYDLKALAVAYTLAQDRAAAQRALKEALVLQETVGDQIGLANSLNSIGVLHHQLQEYKESRKALLSALELHERAGARLSQANDLYTLSDLYARTMHLDQAEETGRRALQLHEEVSDRLGQTNDLRVLAEVQRRRGQLEDAEHSLGRALQLSREVGDRLGQAAAHADLCDLYMKMGRLADAKRESGLKNALELKEQVGFNAGPTLDLKLLGKLYSRIGVLSPVQTARLYAMSIVNEGDPGERWA
ncbi:unnamed protein product [Peniophora sp. CBMAI 1063]|nr:unnamed protein product [Peniophora sp. CBMAI 1063]